MEDHAQHKEQTDPVVIADDTKNRNARKQKTHKKLTAQEHFYARMRLPIGTSSISVPITEDARNDIERYKLELDERHRKGIY